MLRTVAEIVTKYGDGLKAISELLDQWEVARAAFLLDVGRECLAFVRERQEPYGDAEVTARKQARSKAVKDLEDALPAGDGIGAPQVNRWMRWAGCIEVVGAGFAKGLKQGHFMELEKYVDQHEPTSTFRLKPSWAESLAEIQSVLSIVGETGASAKDMVEALDAEAVEDVPQPAIWLPLPVHVLLQSPRPKGGPSNASRPTTSRHQVPSRRIAVVHGNIGPGRGGERDRRSGRCCQGLRLRDGGP